MMAEHERFILQSIELAQRARGMGNHPFGALLVVGDEMVLTAVNTVNSDHDPTRHAELNLVSQAARQFDAATLAQATLYTSTEPCAMCTGAIFWAGIRTIVYSCSAAKLGEIAGGSFIVPCRDLLAYGKPPVTVIGPILEEDGIAVHQGFWE